VGTLALVLRLARRQARRRLGRTVAVLVTLALPVAAAAAIDVVARSEQLSPAEQVARQLGGAQAWLKWTGDTIWSRPTGRAAPSTPPMGLLPPGSVVSPSVAASAGFGSPGAYQTMAVVGERLSWSVFSDLVELRSGHVPTRLGQVALTPSAARALGVGLGGWVTAGPGPTRRLRVVGVVAERSQMGERAYTTPQQALAFIKAPGLSPALVVGNATTWWVKGPRAVTWPDVQRLELAGWEVLSRQVMEHPPPPSGLAYPYTGYPYTGREPTSLVTTATVAVLVFMVLVEVVLLAGPAFAVGARQRERELATLASAGAGPWQLAGVVLADGAVLGLGAAVLGAAAGAGAGAAVLAGLRAWTTDVPGGLKLRWAEIAGLAGVAVVTGLCSALLPALRARRQGAGGERAQWAARRTGPRLTIGGLACLVGAMLSGAHKWGDTSTWYVGTAALGEAALVLLTPAVLQAVGRLGGVMPLWGRMAARDVSRRRCATAPAVAAITAVVASCAAFMVIGASQGAQERAAYQPGLPMGDAFVQMSSASPVAVQDLADRLHLVLPGSAVLVVRGVQGPMCASPTCGTVLFEVPSSPLCALPGPELVGSWSEPMPAGSYTFAGGAQCISLAPVSSVSEVLVVPPEQMRELLGGAPGREAEALLQQGRVVALERGLVLHGAVRLCWSTTQSGGRRDCGPGKGRVVAYPATYVASPAPVADVAMSPSQAARIGPVTDAGIVVAGAAGLPAPRLRAASLVVDRLGYSMWVAQGFRSPADWALLAVVGASLLLVAAASGAVTALIGADSCDELSTLAALGAPPGGRCRLSMARACVIGGIGSAAGTVVGAGVGAMVTTSLPFGTVLLGPGGFEQPSILPSARSSPCLPWQLVLLFFTAPLVAAACGALLRSGRLPVERRQA
jgi:putative ABC transport system permease protein